MLGHHEMVMTRPRGSLEAMKRVAEMAALKSTESRCCDTVSMDFIAVPVDQNVIKCESLEQHLDIIKHHTVLLSSVRLLTLLHRTHHAVLHHTVHGPSHGGLLRCLLPYVLSWPNSQRTPRPHCQSWKSRWPRAHHLRRLWLLSRHDISRCSSLQVLLVYN
jgi:hypothetical protein